MFYLYIFLMLIGTMHLDAMVHKVSQDSTTRIQVEQVHVMSLVAQLNFSSAIELLKCGNLQDGYKTLQRCYELLEGLKLVVNTRAYRNSKATIDCIVYIDCIMKSLKYAQFEINMKPVNLPGIIQHLEQLKAFWQIVLYVCRELPFQFSLRSAL